MTTRKTQPRGKAFWPVVGFLLALSAGMLAFVFTDPTIAMLRSSLRNFPTPNATIRLIVGIIIFALLAMIFSLIVAVTIPRKKSAVTEVQVAKNRKIMVNEKAARKIKQREINRQNKAR